MVLANCTKICLRCFRHSRNLSNFRGPVSEDSSGVLRGEDGPPEVRGGRRASEERGPRQEQTGCQGHHERSGRIVMKRFLNISL